MAGMSYRLESAVERNMRSDGTFEILDEIKRRSLKAGDYAKLIFVQDDPPAPGERMWVEVVSVSGGGYVGRLKNKPSCVAGLAWGDLVEFEPWHVVDIERRADGEA